MRLFKFLPLIFLLFFVVVLFRPFFFEGKLPIPADTIVGLYHPWRDQLANIYPNGVPFKNFLITDPVRQQYVWRELGTKWNPYQSLGTPLLANIQAAQFYPLNLIYKILPFNLGWSFQIISQIFLGGLFMFFYLRHLKLGIPAQTLGTIAWAGSGFFVAWLEWNTLVQVAIWIPLILLSIDQVFAGRRWWPVVFVFALTCSFFAGHLQVFLYVFLLTFAYILKTVLKEKNYSPAKVFFLSYLLFFILTSVQWWPMLTLFQNAIRSVGLADWQNPGWFFPWQNLVQFIAPDFFGNPATLNYFGIWNYGEFVGYIGIIPLFFVLFALRRKNLFWIAVLVMSFLFALPNFISKLPPQLVQPSRLMVLIDFSLVMLAAHGLDVFLQRANKSIWQPALILFAFLGLGLVAWQNGWVVSQKNLILPAGIFVAGLVALKIPRVTVAALLLLTIFDLSRFFIKFEAFSAPQYLFPQTKLTAFLQEKSQTDVFRVAALDDQIFPPNFSTHYKIQMISGYDSFYLKNYIQTVGGPSRIITPKDAKNFDQLNVKYLLSFDDLSSVNYQLVFQEGRTKVYENKNVLPRVSFPAGTARIIHYFEDRVVIETQSETQGVLVLRDAFYPDWVAKIDDKITTIKEVDNLFRGVSVPSGRHEVVFEI